MALLFDSGRHEYFLDGVLLPSTTQILRDSGLIRLRRHSAVHPRGRAGARQRRARAHSLPERGRSRLVVGRSRVPRLSRCLVAVLRASAPSCRCSASTALASRGIAQPARSTALRDRRRRLADRLRDRRPRRRRGQDLQTAGYSAWRWSGRPRIRGSPPCCRSFPALAPRRRCVCADGRSPQFHEYTDPRDYSRFQTLAAAWHIRNERGGIVQPTTSPRRRPMPWPQCSCRRNVNLIPPNPDAIVRFYPNPLDVIRAYVESDFHRGSPPSTSAR
jgi:hypothetical protein